MLTACSACRVKIQYVLLVEPLPLLVQLSAVVCVGACYALLILCSDRKIHSVVGKWQFPLFAYSKRLLNDNGHC